jgi:4-amino-4-deoxy-L-arabinose transferase-like glycosyltransferase
LWILAVAARLVLIDQPFIDRWSLRQSDVAAIARNFSEGGFRFAYPQIDWAGGSAGYVGTEFPILPFLAAICYKFAGIHEWIGRSESVIFFAISLPFFFLLVREIFGSTAAIWATLFFSFAPLNVFAGRSFMPDVPSLSLALIGLYFFLRWLDNERPLLLVGATIAISLALLVKLPTAVIGAPLLFLVWQKWGWKFLKRPSLWFFAAITVLPSLAWYWHAHEIAQQFYPHHFFGEGGVRIESLSWYWHIVGQTAIGSLTPILTIMALIGLFVAPRSRFSGLFRWWLAGVILFVVVVGYGNRHLWYQLPLVPIAAAFAGAACAFVGSKISSRVIAVTLSILLVSSFTTLAFWCVQPFYRSSAAQLRDAGLELKKVTPPEALIVAADMGDPTIFYYGERKGWHFLQNDAIYNGNPDDSKQAIENLERLRRRGATHFVFTKNTFWWLQSYPEFVAHLTNNAKVIAATPESRIYELITVAR